MPDIPGWPNLIDWFGYSPGFHDAEVESIALNRSPEPSVIRIHAWHMNDDVDEKGFYRLSHHATACFILNEIVEQNLSGWNHQNVLMGLQVVKHNEGHALILDGTFGVTGRIAARDISVTIEPRSSD